MDNLGLYLLNGQPFIAALPQLLRLYDEYNSRYDISNPPAIWPSFGNSLFHAVIADEEPEAIATSMTSSDIQDFRSMYKDLGWAMLQAKADRIITEIAELNANEFLRPRMEAIRKVRTMSLLLMAADSLGGSL